MAIVSGLVRIDLRYTFLGQRCETTSYWSPGGAVWLTANATQGAEAWWNNIKGNWRAMVPASDAASFDSVFFQEIGGGTEYGEFAVPDGERLGTRSGGTYGDFLPPYVAVGVRQVVTTHATRPGQKRFPFAAESDNVGGIVQAGFLTLCSNLAAQYTSPATLGSPVAAGTLTPQVARFDKVTHALVAQQETVGAVINTFFTSQVSRRVGHGR